MKVEAKEVVSETIAGVSASILPQTRNHAFLAAELRNLA
jgi:hypothetical protein